MDLRLTFDGDAELYDRARPAYPARLFDDLAEAAGVGPGCRLLEIGAGTGIATVALARKGADITVVELGANMAAVAARRLAAFPGVRVEVASFEQWPLPPEPFDVVFAATAWHWLDPRVRVARAAQALRASGSLAVVETHHIAGGTEDFWVEVQGCYERFDPATPPGLRQSPPEGIPREADTDQSGLFGPAEFRRYIWDRTYTTASYLDVLMTYSNHRALPEADRNGLLTCVRTLIDTRYGGRITKRYMTQLWTAVKR